MKKKIVYIAHPIGGDVVGNLSKIIDIIRHINLTEPEVIPLAPYFGDCTAMNDEDPEERKRGTQNALEILQTGVFDELRLYGDRITSGMTDEINTALIENIRIVPMTTGTHDMLEYAYPAVMSKLLTENEVNKSFMYEQNES